MAATRQRALCKKCGEKKALVKSYCKACAKAEGVEPTPLKGERRTVALEEIDLENSPQVRVNGVDDALVTEYGEAYESGQPLPDVVLFKDQGQPYLCGDGIHRVLGREQKGFKDVSAEVRPGGPREALAYALSANESHGRRRTREDKRNAVRLALADPEWSTWNSSRVAKLCGVSHTFVDTIRKPDCNVATAHPPNPTNSGTSDPPAPDAHPESEADEDAPADDPGDAYETEEDGSDPAAEAAPPEPEANGHAAPATPPAPVVSLFCDRCKRTGPAKNCQACKKLREDTGARAPGSKPKPPPANGRPKFDPAVIDKFFGPLVRSVDEMGNAYGKGSHHERCLRSLKEFYAVFDDWRKVKAGA